MKWLGYKQIAFTSVSMDVADVRARSKAAHVADLAANIREHGDEPIHAPTVRMPGYRLLCGRDRMAALLVLKAKRLWVRLAECSDEEAADLEASENIHRRLDDRDEVIARAVRAKEALLSARAKVGTNVPPSHRVMPATTAPSKQTIKAEARKLVARDHGTTPTAIKQAEKRARAAAKESAAEGSACPTPSVTAAVAVEPAFFEPNLNLLGCDDDSTRAVCKFAKPYQEAIDEADKHLRLALGALKKIEQSALGQELRAQVERVGSLVRSKRPEFICPWCKGLPKATFGICGGCNGQFYVSAEVAARADAKLLEADPPIVAYHGKPMPYADALAGKLPKNGGAGKSIRVVDSDGNDLLGAAMAEEERELADELEEMAEEERSDP
jgi:ParB-like chromosome segregation protein Spo0J